MGGEGPLERGLVSSQWGEGLPEVGRWITPALSTRPPPYFRAAESCRGSFGKQESFRLCPLQTGSEASFSDVHVAGRTWGFGLPKPGREPE